MSLDCYCDDCQAGGRQIEALPGAAPVLQADGGTGYVVYRKDRVRCTKGAALLTALKRRAGSPTNRMVAGCCNTAMLLDFDDGKHWADLYRARVQGAAPPAQRRVCTRFKPAGAPLGGDIPNHPRYAVPFLLKLLAARAAMALRR